jgi:hypothetical protein
MGRFETADPPIEIELQALSAELRRLEGEYTMYFSGRRPRPPIETRGRVEALIKRWDRAHIQGSGPRFLFGSLQARFSALSDLWDRGLRAREEGRGGPLVHRRSEPAQTSPRPSTRVLHVTTFTDPIAELDKLESLYESLMDARREFGGQVVPFHRFADLVKTQVRQLRASADGGVAFRVAVDCGQLSLTARALRGASVH